MEYENIIIGAGPAGIQCGFFFKKYNIKYLILEQNEKCASFFNTFPHSKKLISINKVHTGSTNPEFNLRHDWNSLINDNDLLLKHFSNEYYPDREVLYEYLNDFANKYELNIQYSKQVLKIMKNNNKYYVHLNNNEIYVCNKLIIATGLSQPNIPINEKFECNVIDKIKHYGEYEKDYFLKKTNMIEYLNKRILIIGSGNSAYELGNILNNYASSILIYGRSKNKWALSTHYVGDLRSIYLPYVDTFLLKSLNAIEYNNSKIIINQCNINKYYTIKAESNNNILNFNINFDKVIFCTGWKFNNAIFGFNVNLCINNKYPEINNKYESVNNENLFFIGALMHSHDYKKCSGGFIHGFRYLIKQFVKYNYNIDFDEITIFYLKNKNSYNNFIHNILDRINNSSELYQMFGVICDDIFLNVNRKEALYYKNNMHNSNILCGLDDYIIQFRITLEFGKTITDIPTIGAKLSKIGSESDSAYIHPVIKIFKYSHDETELIDVVHLDEDLFANFKGKQYYEQLYRLFLGYMDFFDN